MERFRPLLLQVWQEACRYIEIHESAERIARVLRQRLPLDFLLVRRLELRRSCVETVGTGLGDGGQLPAQTRSECAACELERLTRWCRETRVQRGDADAVARDLPGLLPAGIAGDVLAGPLNSEAGPQGMLVLVASGARRFRAEHERMLSALLEPLAVALENDRQLRELTTLREAVEAENRALLSRLGRQDIADSIIGAETGLRPIMERVELVARSDAPVLILGETGTGKEVVARAIHGGSRRTAAPFLRLNCGAIPAELIDSELFGHERGSFTGASSQHKGSFERADGGTLFLDEVAELSLAAQVRLLRILQDGSFQRIGGQQPLTVDVRLITATNRDLAAMVRAGEFREDLWYRIAVFPIRLPALRERVEDIPPLAAHFALRTAKRLGVAPLVPSLEDDAVLVSYPWPGNVRELAAVMERAVILGDGKALEVAKALGVEAAAPHPRVSAAPVAFGAGLQSFATLDAAMAQHIEAALARTHGRIEGSHGAAKLLGINPHTLRARMRKLGVNWTRYRIPPVS